MAGRQVTLIWREKLLSSDRFRALTGRERGAFLTTLCLLARPDARSPRFGCLCSGQSPLTAEEWGREVGEARRPAALALWDRLFALGLFEWHEVDGDRYPRVAEYARHQSPSRPRRKPAPKEQPTDTLPAQVQRPSDKPIVDTPNLATPRTTHSPINTVNVPLKGGEEDTERVGDTVAQALNSLSATIERNGNAGLPPDPENATKPFTESEVRRVVSRIELITRDVRSRDNWLRLVRTLGATPQGQDALLAELCDLEHKLTHRDPRAAPIHNPGALLNTRLRETCHRLGAPV